MCFRQWQTTGLLLLTSTGVMGCSAGPVSPSAAATLVVSYTPDTSVTPDPTATGCVHHYAPLFLAVHTSWGADGRLREVDGGTPTLVLRDAPSGDQWLSVIDVRLCSSDAVEPRVRSGVRVNGVPLTRIESVDGGVVLAFTIDARGQIRP